MTHGTFDYSKFPPHAMAGKYRLQLKFYDGPNYMGEGHIDSEVIENIKKWELPRIFN